jgi:hypothetical protein
VSFFAVEQWVKRDLAGQTGILSSDNASKLEKGRFRPKKEARPKGAGRLTRLQRNIGKKRQKTMCSFALG